MTVSEPPLGLLNQAEEIMMTTATVNQASDLLPCLEQFFAQQLKVAMPALDIDLFEAGVLDSLAFVNLLFHLERELQINCVAHGFELDDFRSVRSIVTFIRTRVLGDAASAAEPDRSLVPAI